MGVELYCSAFCDDREQEILDEVTGFFARLESVIPQPAPVITHYEDGFEVTVFSAADPVIFQFEERQLLVSAKTSNAGPGYHAYLVNLLKQLEQQTSVTWIPDQIEDETGYWDNGDFVSIQSSMADWLHSMSAMLMESYGADSDAKNLALSMPLDCMPDNAEHFAVYPLGWLEKDFFQEILSTDNLDIYCRRFFIWWNEGLDAEFYLQYGLYLLWNHINWLPPADDEERRHYSNALRCLETAWRMNPQAELPLAEWYEMAALTEDDSLMQTLKNEFAGMESLTPSLGHLRGDMSIIIGGAWSVKIPGKMHSEMDNNTLVYWDDTLTIRLSHLCVNKDGDIPVPAEELLISLTDDYDCAPYELPEHPEAKSRLLNSIVEEEGSMSYYDTTLFSAVDGCLIIVSCYYDKDEDKSMAMRVINSVKPSSFEQD